MGRGSSEAVASKLRRAMCAPERNPLSGLVEVDETSIRQRAGQGAKGSRGRSHDGKLLIAGAVELVAAGEETTLGRIRLSVIDDFSARSLHGFVAAEIEAGSLVKSDGWSL